MFWFILLLIFVAIVIGAYIYLSQPFDKSNAQMLNGGPGSGKSSSALWLSVYNNYKREMRRYKIKKFLFPGKKFFEPCIYSNVPLYNVPYKEFKLEHLSRKISLQPKSVSYLNEFTLVADSMLAYNIGKDEARMRVNKELQLFMKLIRHETLGGCNGVSVVIDTQNPNDAPMGVDRVLPQTNYILKAINIPFFRLVKIKTMLINLPGVENIINDYDDTGHWHIVSKKVFKMYDSYSYYFLSADKIQDEPIYYTKARSKKSLRALFGKPFIIPTLTNYEEIKKSNAKIIAQNKLNDLEKERILKKYEKTSK